MPEGRSHSIIHDSFCLVIRGYAISVARGCPECFSNRPAGLSWSDCAAASWTAAALCRFSTTGLATPSGRGLPQSKTSRGFSGMPEFAGGRIRMPVFRPSGFERFAVPALYDCGKFFRRYYSPVST